MGDKTSEVRIFDPSFPARCSDGLNLLTPEPDRLLELARPHSIVDHPHEHRYQYLLECFGLSQLRQVSPTHL